MSNKRTITVCTGIGLNMLFPEYITIEIPDTAVKIDQEMVDAVKKVERKRKTNK